MVTRKSLGPNPLISYISEPLFSQIAHSHSFLRILLPGAGAADPEERRKAQVKYGVFYEDDYDYMQHLRSVEEYHNVHLSEPIDVSGFSK